MRQWRLASERLSLEILPVPPPVGFFAADAAAIHISWNWDSVWWDTPFTGPERLLCPSRQQGVIRKPFGCGTALYCSRHMRSFS
jgi:hypothetical protein